LIAIGVAFVYGGMIYGVLPTQSGISFESHLFGAIAGVVAAYTLTRKPPQQVVLTPRTGELKFWPDEQREQTRR
ncbi:MAG: hypothetical protein RL481_1386, partial [Pseudomonadota bacterium]